MTKFLPLVFLLLVACSGSENECADAPAPAPVQVTIEALEEKLVQVNSKAELVALLDKHKQLRDYFLLRSEYPNDSVFINDLFQKFSNAHIDTLLAETKRVFGTKEKLQKDLNEAFGRIKVHYPDFVIPKVQTVLSGFDTDLFVSDTLIIVGLDYYLGKGAKYRPNQYEYILQQYHPENIVPSIMLMIGIDSRINATNLADKTVLADMMAYGKSFYFAKQMLPCTPDSVFMHYTSSDVAGAKKNMDLIWYRLVEDKVLYNTTNTIKQRYLSERPKTIEVGPECPGRIGQWMGWQIINSYMQHNDVSLPELMQNAQADVLFKQSKFNPRK
ncbi:MAG: gliding motility lipoprotein GldB [Cyclobacteriaceae bacterium]|jgi:hypothetical protein|nr:gliding motility lipoprotein GldB [Cytophagales bacterium]MCZ8327404.1 gliding motility lipoprotein GldB [Cyclobacteriaceae bacterium]